MQPRVLVNLDGISWPQSGGPDSDNELSRVHLTDWPGTSRHPFPACQGRPGPAGPWWEVVCRRWEKDSDFVPIWGFCGYQQFTMKVQVD